MFPYSYIFHVTRYFFFHCYLSSTFLGLSCLKCFSQLSLWRIICLWIHSIRKIFQLVHLGCPLINRNSKLLYNLHTPSCSLFLFILNIPEQNPTSCLTYVWPHLTLYVSPAILGDRSQALIGMPLILSSIFSSDKVSREL